MTTKFTLPGGISTGLLKIGAYLTEVADGVAAFVVHQRHHVEQKRLYVVIQCLVIKKKLGQKAQVLAILFVFLSIYLNK